MTRPPTRVKRPKRLRAAPKQAYLSRDELEQLNTIMERRGCTFSELVRRWILREQARYETRIRGPQEPQTHDDPRQLAIEGSRR